MRSANDSILEIGMGNGNFVKDLFEINPDITYVGCDFSEKMVEESTKNNAQLIADGKGISFCKCRQVAIT
jgi:tRNA G46 methylase TrmB